MAAPTPPNNNNPPKKPNPTTPTSGAGGVRPPGAPVPGAKTPAAGTPPVKPVAGVTKPAPGATKPTSKPAPKVDPRKKWGGSDGGVRRIGQVLVDLGFIDELQIESVADEARESDLPLDVVALNRGLINEDQQLTAVAEQNGLKIVNLEEIKPQPEAIKLVSQNMAELYKMLPLSYENDTLTVVLADPNNLQSLDEIKNFIGVGTVAAVLGSQGKLTEMIAKAYSGKKEQTLQDLIASFEGDEILGKVRRETSIDLDDLGEIANAAPVRKLINMVLLMGIRDHASDIHFEPFEDEYKMRYRCDGVLYEMVPPPRHLAMAISSRIKVMSNLDIAERRMPQDGRIELNIGGNSIDMRVSVLPTMFGESVVIRVLDRTVVNLDLNKGGMPKDILADFRKLINKPNGITLVTGPTGAGKTTTLYSALNELNVMTDKIITTEDPVEYEIDGIIQVPINHEIDLTFAIALRAILRQDPDKILVGEIRDLETAQIAIQAALTGHMVFSTLHTNDSVSTITRLRDMGVEPYLITATVEGILAQRLVRKVCPKCKIGYDPSRDQLMELNLPPADLKGRQFYYGEGCDNCNNLGFRGRVGIYELLTMDDAMRDMISKGTSTDNLRRYSRSVGIRGLRDAGLDALYAGLTSIDEIVRETVLEDEG